MKNLPAHLLVLGAASLAACIPASAQIVQNGSFECSTTINCGLLNPTTQTAVPFNAPNTFTNDGAVANWTMTGGDGSTYVSANINNYPSYIGNYSASFGSLPGSAATISQTITDVAGQSYDLDYYLDSALSDGAPSQFYASIDGVEQTASLISNVQPFGYEEFILPFTGNGTDTISFTGDNTDGEFELDDVSVATAASNTSVTPEPSSLILLGTGILGVAGAARRRLFQA